MTETMVIGGQQARVIDELIREARNAEVWAKWKRYAGAKHKTPEAAIAHLGALFPDDAERTTDIFSRIDHPDNILYGRSDD